MTHMWYNAAEGARLLRAAQRGIQLALGEDLVPDWNDRSEGERIDSANRFEVLRRQVTEALAAGKTLEEIAAIDHGQWMALRVSQGWTWAAVTDRAALKHSSLVPFSQLTAMERAKDTVRIMLIIAMSVPFGQD